MKKFRSLLGIAAIIMIGIVSCSKTGDTGPVGPPGPDGPAGPDSVLHSGWIPLNLALNAANTAYVDSIVAPALTQAILSDGVILSYVNFEDQDGDHIVAVTALETFSLVDEFSVGKINLFADGDYSGLPYRYVFIPGSLIVGNGEKAKFGSYTVGELKSMSYEQVQKALAEPRN